MSWDFLMATFLVKVRWNLNVLPNFAITFLIVLVCMQNNDLIFLWHFIHICHCTLVKITPPLLSFIPLPPHCLLLYGSFLSRWPICIQVTRVYIHTCTCASSHLPCHTCTHTHVHVYTLAYHITHINIHMFMCMLSLIMSCEYAYTHMHAHVLTHIYMLI